MQRTPSTGRRNPSEGRSDLSAVVRIAQGFAEAIVARGAGTGLRAGAVPVRGGVVVSFAKMNRVLELDLPYRRARVRPGRVNLALSKAPPAIETMRGIKDRFEPRATLAPGRFVGGI